MTTLQQQAAELAEQLRKCVALQGQAGEHETAAMQEFLRQIAALGDGEGLTDEQIYPLLAVGGRSSHAYVAIQHGRMVEAAATLPYKATIADHNRLVRELDIALNGDGAAEQASLCDLVSQVVAMKARIAELEATVDDLDDKYQDWQERHENQCIINKKLQEQLAASQAREQALHDLLDEINQALHRVTRQQGGVQAALQMIKDCPAFLPAIPSDLTALHADRKATIERVRGIVEQINADFADGRLDYDGRGVGGALYATNLLCGQLNQAAERAGKGEPI